MTIHEIAKREMSLQSGDMLYQYLDSEGRLVLSKKKIES